MPYRISALLTLVVWSAALGCAATQAKTAAAGCDRINSDRTLVSRMITSRTVAAHQPAPPGAAQDRRPRRVAQSAGGSPRPGSAPAGRGRPQRLRSGLTALRLPLIDHAAPRARASAL